jgi:hypothetical protein
MMKSGNEDSCTAWLAKRHLSHFNFKINRLIIHVLESEQVSIRRKGLALFKLEHASHIAYDTVAQLSPN